MSDDLEALVARLRSGSTYDDRTDAADLLESLQARVAELEGALSSVRSVLVKAFNRVHCLPRSSDTELADKIEATLGAIRAALEGKKDEA